MRRFSEFACIDWSGAHGRWQPGIAVALCAEGRAAPRLIAPPQRHWTRWDVVEWLQVQAATGRNMLVGLDLSFALPFIDAGAYFPGWDDSPTDARTLWRTVDAMSPDDHGLSANQFISHAEVARHFRQIGSCGDRFGSGRGRMRRCEADGQALIDGISPYSCFNLVGAAQVGKSSLTGMRLLHRLAGQVAIWPFDMIADQGLVIVEIYTSIAARASRRLPPGRSKIRDAATLDAALASFDSMPHGSALDHYSDHATDAILTSAWMRHVAGRDEYWRPGKLDDAVRRTEGWTFGVI